MTDKGMIYFICPAKMEKTKGSLAEKPLLYDITCPPQNDTVSVTATIWTKNPYRAEKAGIVVSGNIQKTVDVENIYVEPCKSRYISRVRFKILWTELKELFQSQTPFAIEFNDNVSFMFPVKQWAARREEVSNIIQIIEFNRK